MLLNCLHMVCFIDKKYADKLFKLCSIKFKINTVTTLLHIKNSLHHTLHRSGALMFWLPLKEYCFFQNIFFLCTFKEFMRSVCFCHGESKWMYVECKMCDEKASFF